MTSQRPDVELMELGMLSDLNVATLELGSTFFFSKLSYSLQMLPFSPKMHKKLSIIYKAIKTLITK